MPPLILWVTARCALEDLAIDPWPPHGLGSVEDGLIERFRHLRSHYPEPLEDRVSQLVQRVCCKLRVHDHRAITWYDRTAHTVFLVAAGPRHEDSRDDVYEYARRLEDAGRLYPTAQDYGLLEFDRIREDFRRLRIVDGPQLLAEARAAEGQPIPRDLALARLAAVAFHVDGDGWIYQLLIEPPESEHLSDEQSDEIADAIFLGGGITWSAHHRFLQHEVPWPARAYQGLGDDTDRSL